MRWRDTDQGYVLKEEEAVCQREKAGEQALTKQSPLGKKEVGGWVYVMK